jgi:hypothetical protein
MPTPKLLEEDGILNNKALELLLWIAEMHSGL